jgi:predicted metal-dependent peptidase
MLKGNIMAVSNIEKAKVEITLRHPFFASILMKRKLTPRTDIGTAAVDRRGQIFYNPEWIKDKTVDELVFLLCHEVGHVIGQHAARLGNRSHKKWNIASDAWINDMLKASSIGSFIDGGVDMPGSKDKTVDEIYNNLPDGPDGDGPGGTGDDLLQEGTPMTQEELDKLDAETRVEIAQAAQAAKMQGKMPDALQKFVAELIEVQTPWHDILERYMTSLTKGDYSWARPNRRFSEYLPSVGNTQQMGDVVIQVDVSGSISERELAYYNGHLKRIVELCNPEKVHVLYTDTDVVHHDVFERGEEFGLNFRSGGGTDMEAGFDYLAAKGIEPEVFVCLTDGYTSFDEAKQPGYDVVWCISSDVEAPYGTNIHFSMDQK